MAIYERFGDEFVDVSRIFKIRLDAKWVCIDIQMVYGRLGAVLRNRDACPTGEAKKAFEELAEVTNAEIQKCMDAHKKMIDELAEKYPKEYWICRLGYEEYFNTKWAEEQWKVDVSKLEKDIEENVIGHNLPEELKSVAMGLVHSTAEKILGIQNAVYVKGAQRYVARVVYYAKDETQKGGVSVFYGKWKDYKSAEKEATDWISGVATA